MDPRAHILIVGGGLAGLTAAAYLRKDHRVTVLERYDGRFGGSEYGLSIICNASKLLQRLGVDQGRLDSVLITKLWRRDYTDHSLLAETPFDTSQTFGGPSYFVLRSKLQAELLRLATDESFMGEPAIIRPSAKVVSVDVHRGTATTEDGQTYQGDILIGADGVRSSIRREVLKSNSDVVEPFGVEPWTTPVIGCSSILPREVLASDAELAFQATDDGHAGLCFYVTPAGGMRSVLAYPVDSKRFQVFAYMHGESWLNRFPNGGRSSLIPGVDSAELLKGLEDAAEPIKRLVLATGTMDVRKIQDVERLEKWSAGRALLIGDAAHGATPHAGQGCNMAIEDAEALAYFLRGLTKAPSADDVQERFNAFMALRVPRTHFIQLTSRRSGRLISKEEEEALGPADRMAFMRRVYSYDGAEAALKGSG